VEPSLIASTENPVPPGQTDPINPDAKIDELNNDYNTEKQSAEDKKKTGRQYREDRNKKLTEEKEKEAYRQSFTGLGKTLITMICDRLPNPKPLTTQELEQFDNAFTAIAMKYMAFVGKYQEETALLMITAFIILPRTDLLTPKKKDAKLANVKPNPGNN
jgi:hypothetical protein